MKVKGFPRTTLSGLISQIISSGVQLVTGGSVVDSSNPLPVIGSASEAHIGQVGGKGITLSSLFSRPNNVTPYVVGGAVSDSTTAPTVQSIAGVVRVSGGSSYITKIRLTTDNKTNVSRYRLRFYSVAPTALNDNVAFPLLWENRDKRLGYVDLDAMSTEDATTSNCAETEKKDVLLHFVAATGSTTLYWTLTALDARTPIASEQFFLELTLDQA